MLTEVFFRREAHLTTQSQHGTSRRLSASVPTNSGLYNSPRRRIETDEGANARFGCVSGRGPIVETFFRRVE